jgi:hypothetical protein
MIEIDDLDATSVVTRRTEEAIRLLDIVRREARQAEILPFVRHMDGTVGEVETVLAEVEVRLGETGKLDDRSFSQVYAAGAAHGAMALLCRQFRDDPCEHVRLACAAGEIALGRLAISRGQMQIIDAVKRRLDTTT